MHIVRNMTISAFLLGLFSITGTGVVAFTFEKTKQKIAENERAAMVASLHQLITPKEHDNDLYADVIQVSNEKLLGTDEPVNVYRARMKDKPVAAILNSVAPDGYSGNIYLLVAIRFDGTLAGVRVVKHKETPGLGDGIEIERSNWILGFNSKSLTNPPTGKWRVKRDGGVFDQMTGATITPRAVVKAVKNTLNYYQANKDMLFKTPANKDIQ
ncbi:MAG: electron transport complex subunit RsxG [Gammaproteobacteria bacterium]|nr:electron transport complex subunit RsxG [Gammaproteobacteria bacterium]